MQKRIYVCTEQNKRMGRRCEVSDCLKPSKTVSRYCEKHSKATQRYGHPKVKAVRVGEYRYYLRLARAFIEEHSRHPSVTQAITWADNLLNEATFEASKHPYPNGETWAWHWLVWLHRAGWDGRQIVEVVLAHFIRREAFPLRYPNDQSIHHAVVRSILRDRQRPTAIKSKLQPLPTRAFGGLLCRSLGRFAMSAAASVLRGLNNNQNLNRKVAHCSG